jgi:hypothetical protein
VDIGVDPVSGVAANGTVIDFSLLNGYAVPSAFMDTPGDTESYPFPGKLNNPNTVRGISPPGQPWRIADLKAKIVASTTTCDT